MEYIDWFATRLAELRMEKGVSARDMSLSLGQSESYINKIENQRSLPSMQVFFYLCEYLNITPEEFFDRNVTHPLLLSETLAELEKLDSNQLEHILAITKDINGSKNTTRRNK